MGSSHVDISSEEVFKRERTFGAHNYHPLPVALCRAQGEFTLLYIVERICANFIIFIVIISLSIFYDLSQTLSTAKHQKHRKCRRGGGLA